MANERRLSTEWEPHFADYLGRNQRRLIALGRYMTGRKHHTVPQFLLRAFASRTSGKEAYVWTYRRRESGVEINTRNIGAERDFYGSELDARITALETGFAPLAATLRR